MSDIKMRGLLVGIEGLTKLNSRSTESFIVPNTVKNIGLVRYISSAVADIALGDKVYFGDKYECLKIEGEDILVMHEENVYATIEDPCAKETSGGTE